MLAYRILSHGICELGVGIVTTTPAVCNDPVALLRNVEELERIGECLDPKGVDAITKLPTKQELMGQTATLLKVLPAKLARTLNAAGAGRLARATKQASGQKLVQAVKAMEGKKE